MKGRKKLHKSIPLLVLIYIFSARFFWAESYDNIAPQYDILSSSWLNEEISNDDLIFNLIELENSAQMITDEKDSLYWTAKIQLLKGFVWFRTGDEEQSISELEKSKITAHESMKDGEYSEGWRLLSEAGSYIMLQKGLGYIIANSGDVQEQAENALALNEKNRRAELIVAQGMLNAPRIFGGNKKKGIEKLEFLSKEDDLDNESRYFIMSALSEAYIALKRNDDAIRNYRMMLSLYPGSTYITEKLNNLR